MREQAIIEKLFGNQLRLPTIKKEGQKGLIIQPKMCHVEKTTSTEETFKGIEKEPTAQTSANEEVSPTSPSIIKPFNRRMTMYRCLTISEMDEPNHGGKG
jgi:hypothetical protein